LAQSRKRKKERRRTRATAVPEPDAAPNHVAAVPGRDATPHHAGNGAERSAPEARGYARSRAKDEAARAALKPLPPGERPGAVTVGAAVATVLAIGNIVLYIAGVEVRGQKPTLQGIAGPTLIMLVAAWGMWRRKYWAVLGVEALLGIIIVFFSLLALRAENVRSVLIALLVIVPSGVLFWFLIKAMARIQMPERPARTDR
jgi:hypothetical protein